MATRLGYFEAPMVSFSKPHSETLEIAKQIVTLLHGMPIGQALITLERVEMLLGAGNHVDVTTPSYQELIEVCKNPDLNL